MAVGTLGGRLALVLVVLATCWPTPAFAEPTLHLDVWKTTVIEREPLLVRVSIDNPDAGPISLVPPTGIVLEGRSGSPVVLQVLSTETGAVVEEVRGGGAGPWWHREEYLTGQSAWEAPPGGSAFMWWDVASAIAELPPGKYRMRLQYDPTTAMVEPPDQPGSMAEIWEGHLEAESEEFAIAAPEGEDAAALDWMRSHNLWSFSAPADPTDPTDWLLQHIVGKHPGSTYGPYARFYRLWRRAQVGRSHEAGFADGREEAERAVAEFAAEYPDFPLNYQLPVIVAYGMRRSTRDPVYRVRTREWEELLEVTRQSGDCYLMQQMTGEYADRKARAAGRGFDRGVQP